MEKYIDLLKKEKIYIEDNKEILDLWQKSDDGIINFLSIDDIEKEDSILGKIAYLWEINHNKIGYYYDGLLKGKVIFKHGRLSIFNSIKEYYDYYKCVIAKQNDEKYIAKHGIDQKQYLSFEQYCFDALSFEKDDSIRLVCSENYDEYNFNLCKKLLRIWKYKLIDENDNIDDEILMNIILELLPNANIKILEEYINIKEKKHIVCLICERIAKSNNKFALDLMKVVLHTYKKEMEDFHYVEDEEYDSYYKVLKYVDYFEEKNRGI